LRRQPSSQARRKELSQIDACLHFLDRLGELLDVRNA
jgi:hypothetical protein